MTYHDITCLYLIELGKRGIDPDSWRDRIAEFAEVSMGTEPEIRQAIDLDIVKAQFPGQCVGLDKEPTSNILTPEAFSKICDTAADGVAWTTFGELEHGATFTYAGVGYTKTSSTAGCNEMNDYVAFDAGIHVQCYDFLKAGAEQDPNKLTPKEPGCKLDAGKQIAGELVFSFPRAMQALIEVATFGAKKYSRSGFLSVPDAHKRYMDALMRHLLAYGSGEEMDPESGMPHMWHALWNAAALVELKRREEEIKP